MRQHFASSTSSECIIVSITATLLQQLVGSEPVLYDRKLDMLWVNR